MGAAASAERRAVLEALAGVSMSWVCGVGDLCRTMVELAHAMRVANRGLNWAPGGVPLKPSGGNVYRTLKTKVQT